MSVEVPLGELAEAAARYRFAYLVTVDDAARPHIVAVTPVVDADTVRVGALGRRTLANLTASRRATLAWPPQDIDGFSLIVDGEVASSVDPATDPVGDTARIRPTRAVLHRPAPRPGGAAAGGCVSDCSEIPVSPGTL